MKIGEVAARSGVSVDTVRFYERRGVLAAPERRASGYRSYTSAAVQRIILAKRLQALGLTINEIVDALAAIRAGEVGAEQRERLTTVLDRIDARIAELQATRTEVRRALDACANGRCDFCDLATAITA